jgi:bifunctional DNA-binding transcriptional regulator/antitoxin component of YhaV-PrlF toxin-antitoxin module
MVTATITSKEQTTIPKTVRDSLHLFSDTITNGTHRAGS